MKAYDLVVIGAGPSGTLAAISAARAGAKVLLIEKNGYPGGTNTAGMVNPLMTFHAGRVQVIKGLAQEIVDRLGKYDATLGHIPDPIGMVSTITPIDTEVLKIVYFEMLSEEPKITVLFNTFLLGSSFDEGKVNSVTVVNKSGISVYKGKNFIDASGDGDLAFYCKAEYTLGRTKDGFTQPMTLMFKANGVNISKIVKYVQQNPEQFILNSSCDLNKYLAVSGFFKEITKAKEAGDLNIPRDRVLFFQGIHPGEVLVNMSRVVGMSGVNAKDLSIAEVEAYKQVKEIMNFLIKYIPGFEHAYIQGIADVTGVRESRRIIGRKTLTIEDVLENREQEDSVALCAYPIDIHDPLGSDLIWMRKEQGSCYDIPFGIMVPKHFSNLLVTGRCVSAVHEALASARISATAMAMGEAAGLATALATKHNIPVADCDISELQKQLVLQNAIPGKKWL